DDAELSGRVDQAVAAVAAAEAELRDVVAATQSVRDEVGQLASRAYRTGGMTQLSLILQAQTPGELLGRIQTYRTVLQADHETLARLERTRDSIDARRAELDRRRDEAGRRREAAAKHL
ncbi:hypothetical protein, partial [Streptomyces sp. SID3343]|uniref:hypothetical protein n=1 Tax=Streptomyces sp. SID3343 TaxID=2690260 RepID=UPI0013C0C1D6